MTTDAVPDDPSILATLAEITGAIEPHSDLHLNYTFKHAVAAQAAHGEASQQAAAAMASLMETLKARYGYEELKAETQQRLLQEALAFARDRNSAFNFPIFA